MASSKGRQVLAALAACMGAFSLGTVLGYTNTIKNEMTEALNLTDTQFSWIGSVTALGALGAGPITGFCIEKLGRKTVMLILSLPFVLGWLLITYALTFTSALVGRLLTGFCGGAFSLVAPVYVGETAQDDIRGTLGSGFQLMVVIGIEFAYAAGIGVTWEWLALISAFGPLVFLVMMMFPPESPRYLVSKGCNVEAFEALRWLRPGESNQDVEHELERIQTSVDEAKQQRASWKDLLNPPILKPTLIGMALMFFQQFSGINAVIFYSSGMFEDAGSDLDPRVAAVIVGGVQIAATLVASVLMDRMGRRLLLLISDVVMAVCLVLLGVFFWLKEREQAEGLEWLPLVSLIVFVIAFSLGFGPIPWLMMGELLPPRVKGIASAICTSFNWTLAFLVTKFFEDINKALTAKWCYWSFAIMCGIGTLFVFTLVPETKGKSLDEIQEYFGASSSTTTPNQPSVDYVRQENEERGEDED